MTLSRSTQQLERLARQALGSGRDEEAYRLLGELLIQQPDHVEAFYLLSFIAHKYGNYRKEVELLKQAVSGDSDNQLLKAYLARALALCGDLLFSYQTVQAIDLKKSNNPELIDVVATTYNRLNLYGEACNCYQRLVEIDKSNAFIWFNLSTCYKYMGDFERAEESLLKAISLKPNYEKAQAALTLLNTRNGNCEKETITRVSELENIQSDSKHLEAKLHIAHAIAKELESIGEYSKAFSVLAKYKGEQRRLMGYSFDKDKSILEKLIVRPSYTLPKLGNIRNIFVTGMPRTGTTLVDRLLSSSETVNSAGELQCFRTSLRNVQTEKTRDFITSSCLEDLDEKSWKAVGRLYQENTSYFVGKDQVLLDKLPLNILLADQILRCVENSVVVCLDRHPLDTIVGNYRQLFSFSDASYNYSLTLKDTAKFYVYFKKLTQRLSRDYPDRFYLVNYDRLVNNPEEEAEKLFNFCQLPWDSEYLAIDKNTSPVATASSLQVREKIHTRSVSQWKRYTEFLEEAKFHLKSEAIEY